jgi:hypothetical protein
MLKKRPPEFVRKYGGDLTRTLPQRGQILPQVEMTA